MRTWSKQQCKNLIPSTAKRIGWLAGAASGSGLARAAAFRDRVPCIAHRPTRRQHRALGARNPSLALSSLSNGPRISSSVNNSAINNSPWTAAPRAMAPSIDQSINQSHQSANRNPTSHRQRASQNGSSAERGLNASDPSSLSDRRHSSAGGWGATRGGSHPLGRAFHMMRAERNRVWAVATPLYPTAPARRFPIIRRLHVGGGAAPGGALARIMTSSFLLF